MEDLTLNRHRLDFVRYKMATTVQKAWDLVHYNKGQKSILDTVFYDPGVKPAEIKKDLIRRGEVQTTKFQVRRAPRAVR